MCFPMLPAAARSSFLPAAAAVRLSTRFSKRCAPPEAIFRAYGFSAVDSTEEGAEHLSFTDHKAIYEGRSTSDLLRALVVLRLCANEKFVQNSELLLDAARKYLGDEKANAVVDRTFYRHFCAGQHASDVWSRMNALRAHGIGAILDFAEEEDLLPHCRPQPKAPCKAAEEAAASPAAAAGHQQQQQQRAGADAAGAAPAAAGTGISGRAQLGGESLVQSKVVARTYSYEGEEACERHLQAFLAAIDTAATLPGQGFAAIKLTALGDPALLERLSNGLRRVVGLFTAFDEDGDGFIDRQEFERNHERLTGAGSTSTHDERDSMFNYLDVTHSGKVDYVSWAEQLDLKLMPALAARLQATSASGGVGGGSGGSAMVGTMALTEAEQEQMSALFKRLDRLVERALAKGVKLMIDGEHSLFQPAIDHVAHALMRRHNVAAAGNGLQAGASGEASIFLTYQAYCRDARQRLQRDLQRAQQQGYTLGVKLVRGAYLHLERRRAAEAGVPSPVFDHIAETHASFDACLAEVMQAVKEGRAEVMVGSHNQASVEACVGLMKRLGLAPDTAPVYFGQLMGMADHLSFPLGHAGYRVFKYVPYGRVDKVVPYLLRRANENQYILKGGKVDVELLQAELLRRLRERLGMPAGSGSDGGQQLRSA